MRLFAVKLYVAKQRRYLIFAILQLLFAVVGFWWLYPTHLPAPGYSVALLAVAAAFMSVAGDMTQWEKARWCVIIALLLVVEFHAIHKDRKDNQDQANADRLAQEKSFAAILAKQKQDFDATAASLTSAYKLSQTGFDKTLGQMGNVLNETQAVAITSKQNLDTLSGAGSVPCVIPDELAINQDRVPFIIWNRGKNVLTGVQVSIYTDAEYRAGRQSGNLNPTVIGTLTSEWAKSIPAVVPVAESDGIARYQAEISTQNGFYNEVINFRRSKKTGGWVSQYWLSQMQTVGPHDKKRFPKIPVGACLRATEGMSAVRMV